MNTFKFSHELVTLDENQNSNITLKLFDCSSLLYLDCKFYGYHLTLKTVCDTGL